MGKLFPLKFACSLNIKKKPFGEEFYGQYGSDSNFFSMKLCTLDLTIRFKFIVHSFLFLLPEEYFELKISNIFAISRMWVS